MTYIHTTPWALYNEIDEYAADWLENLIARGLIAPGVVDRRSIEDLRPYDLRGFRQVHLFAGIGVWSYGCRRAGISDDTTLWTGSCPCQPFSAAGKGTGVDDERHLWPAFYHLIRECRPKRVFGEQVASKDGLSWLDLVFADMEKAGYAIGAVDTCSAGSGAPHIRQRLRFAAYDLGPAASRLARSYDYDWWSNFEVGGSEGRTADGRSSTTMRLADNSSVRRNVRPGLRDSGSDGIGRNVASNTGAVGWMDHHHHEGLEGLRHGHSAETRQRQGSLRPVATPSGIEWVADNESAGRQERHSNLGGCGERSGSEKLEQRSRSGSLLGHNGSARPTNGFWSNADWLFCRDGKWRPVEPGTFPLAHGATYRVGRLRAYGNAVDAEATTYFLEAFLEKDTIDLGRERLRDAAGPAFEDLI